MPSPPGRPSYAPGRPKRPTRLGKWEVVAKIAGGGMATIYLGRPVDAAEPVVALKVLKNEHRQDDRVTTRFVEEAGLLARIVHPGVVQILDAGADEAADCRFIAMELMLGATLAAAHDTAVARGALLPSDVVAWIGARVAEALHYAHELKDDSGKPLAIIHRDVNPRNIFVTFDGGVKLFDFGMASSQGSQVVSSPGIVAGTLPYLAPEQIMQLPLDRRADLFALGTTLWELSTGNRLFKRDQDHETVRAVHVGKIPDPRSVVPAVPEHFARVIMKLLERNREHRYPTGAALAKDLDQYLASRRPPKPPQQVLASAIDQLFPGERKRQQGWLKPRVSSGSTASMAPPSLRPPTTRKT
jgi:serine/threonine-protein kinase